MSKKLYSTAKWRRRMKRRSENEQRRRNSPRRHSASSFKSRQLERTLQAPVNFSLITNPQSVVLFLSEIERNISECRLTIDFEDVITITPEAVLAMTATMKKYRTRTVKGSLPRCAAARQTLKDCGFLDHVSHELTLEAAAQGHFAKFQGTMVDPVQAQTLIQIGSQQMSGSLVDTEAAYCVILEAMQNTRDHARSSPIRGLPVAQSETWWAMVYSDLARERVCFALVDTGVGIFKSAKLKAWRKADRLLRKTADISILKQMLEGGIESRTGLSYRGKGLPQMNRYSRSGEIRNFVIVSNAVHGNIEAQKFTALERQFNGTMLYWEIGR